MNLSFVHRRHKLYSVRVEREYHKKRTRKICHHYYQKAIVNINPTLILSFILFSFSFCLCLFSLGGLKNQKLITEQIDRRRKLWEILSMALENSYCVPHISSIIFPFYKNASLSAIILNMCVCV